MLFKRPQVRYSDTPEPVTPYQAAAQVWDSRCSSGRPDDLPKAQRQGGAAQEHRQPIPGAAQRCAHVQRALFAQIDRRQQEN